MIVFFDTETTGKLDFKALPTDDCQPDLVQLAACLTDDAGERIFGQINLIIQPPHLGPWIPELVSGIHGITDEIARSAGQPRRTALSAFNFMCKNAESLVAHNLNFDGPVMITAYHREGVPHRMTHLKRVCTMLAATPVLKLPKPDGWQPRPGDEYKWPKLMECYQFFTGQKFEGAHNAMNDVMAMVTVFRGLRALGAI